MPQLLLPIVEASLQTYGLDYRAIECDPELADTAAFCAHYGFTPDQSANTIFVVGKAAKPVYAACVVLADSRLDVNGAVRRLLGSKKASFAPMDTALELSHMEYGGITIFGLPDNIPVFVDARVLDQNEIVMGGGNRTSKVVLPAAELNKLPTAQIIADLAKPIA